MRRGDGRCVMREQCRAQSYQFRGVDARRMGFLL